MNPNKFRICFTLLFITLLGISSTLSTTTSIPCEQSVGGFAPDFEIVDIYTNISSHLSDYIGKVVILDLWATWCGPCREAIPQLVRIQKLYNASDLQIISIDVDTNETYSQVKNFAIKYNMTWLVTRDITNMNQDYGTGYIPTLYVINQTGYITYTEIGFNYAGVVNALDLLLAAGYTESINNTTTTKSVPIPYPTILFLIINLFCLYGWNRKKKKKKLAIPYFLD
ncbi:MAG: TlpA family protein disulfide reductase [Candidatus Hodarchaeota archaeon]